LQEVVVEQANLIRIGISRGIRLSKPVLEFAGLTDEVEIAAAPVD
jgi:hypothetical protein